MQELFSGQKLTRTEELRNTSSIPKVGFPQSVHTSADFILDDSFPFHQKLFCGLWFAT